MMKRIASSLIQSLTRMNGDVMNIWMSGEIQDDVGDAFSPTTLPRPRRDAATQLAEADPLGL
jgi:hypothetical protein